EAEAGEDLLGHRRSPQHRPALEDDDLLPRPRQVGRGDEAVVAPADDHRVVGRFHERTDSSLFDAEAAERTENQQMERDQGASAGSMRTWSSVWQKPWKT